MIPPDDRIVHEFHRQVDLAFGDDWPDRPDPDWLPRLPVDDDDLIQMQIAIRSSWNKLYDSGAMNRLQFSLPLMPNNLFICLLPAFLKHSIVDPCESWLDVVNQLAPPWKQGTAPELPPKLANLSRDQVAVLKTFLDLIIAHSEEKPNILRRVSAIREELLKRTA